MNEEPVLPPNSDPTASGRFTESVPDSKTSPENGPEKDFDVFISYRVQPDNYLAGAVKKLIEQSIDPSPRVFVSGLGGLRASATGFKSQIQKAIQTSKAVIGIITKHSKQREWIFYEAGAAFGMGTIYAPIIFDINFSDLPSSISDYQSTDYKNETAILDLITKISEETSSSIKKGFSRRYKTFLQNIKEESGEDEIGDKEEIGDSISLQLSELRKLVSSEKFGDAAKKRDEIMALCDSPEFSSRKYEVLVNCTAILANGDQVIEHLEALPDEAKKCETYHILSYIHLKNYRPHRAEEHLRKYIAEKSGDEHGSIGSVKAYINLSNPQEAANILRRMLKNDKQEIRRQASLYIAENKFPGMSVGERLLCSLRGLVTFDHDLLLNIGSLAYDNNLFPLSAYCFKTISEKKPNANDIHRYGMSLGNLELYSLTYEAYSAAEKHGLSVSIATKAALFGHGKVAAHGVRILSQHTSGFPDAASQAYPHGVRRDLEQMIESEKGSLETIIDKAYKLLLFLADYSDRAFSKPAGSSIPLNSGVVLNDTKYMVSNGQDLESALLIPSYFEMNPGVILTNYYFSTETNKICMFRSDGTYIKSLISNFDKESISCFEYENAVVRFP